MLAIMFGILLIVIGFNINFLKIESPNKFVDAICIILKMLSAQSVSLLKITLILITSIIHLHVRMCIKQPN